MRRRDVALAVIAVVVAAVCVRLGIWQLHRLKERLTFNVSVEMLLSLPPIELRDARLTGDSDWSFRRVVASGVYDFGHERTWPARSFEGTPGVALITPLRLADGSQVLVDRGWVPSPDAFHVDHGAYREPDTASIAGIARITPRGRGDVDTTGFLPFVIELQKPGPPAARGLPRRWPPLQLDNGPHLSYAIQWFSFALIAVVGTAVVIRKGR